MGRAAEKLKAMIKVIRPGFRGEVMPTLDKEEYSVENLRSSYLYNDFMEGARYVLVCAFFFLSFVPSRADLCIFFFVRSRANFCACACVCRTKNLELKSMI